MKMLINKKTLILSVIIATATITATACSTGSSPSGSKTVIKDNQGYITTDSGLKYKKLIQQGTGKSPSETDTVTVHYEGRLTTGEVFDSSYKRGTPASFPLNAVIKGWTEGLQLMKEGEKFELYIPSDLAYGKRGTRGIPPNSPLVFTVELIKVK